MDKVTQLGALTIHPIHLESTDSATPNGYIHAHVQGTVEERGDGSKVTVYALEPVDRKIMRADFVQRARELHRDVAQYLADEGQTVVRASADVLAATISPSKAE
jgi:hypothetical protein